VEKIRTHYDNLQVMRSASPEVIKAAYRSLSQKYHPDRNLPERRTECERIMKVINQSYATLSDPELRAKHDRWIAEQEGRGSGANANAGANQAQREKRPSQPPPAPVRPELLTVGSVLWKHLPTSARHFLSQARTNPSNAEFSVRAFSYKPIAWGIAAAAFILFVVFSNAASGRWTGNEELITIAVSFASFLVIACLLVLLTQLWKVPPGRELIVTLTHIVYVNLTSVTFWPIAGTERFRMTVFTKEGSFDRSEIVFAHVKGGNRTFTLYDEGKSSAAYTLVHRVLQLVAQDPRGYERQLAESPLSNISTSGFFGANYVLTAATAFLAAVVGTAIFHLGLLRPENLQAKVMSGPPPQTMVSSAEAPTYQEPKSPGPTAEASTPAFDQPEELLPLTGWLSRPRRHLFAPLVIHTPLGSNYFFKVVGPNNQTIGTFFIRGGDTLKIDAPIGSFTFRYAYGAAWYGLAYLFGPETRYTELEGSMNFTRHGENVEGVELTLVKQEHGNMRDHPLAPVDF